MSDGSPAFARSAGCRTLGEGADAGTFARGVHPAMSVSTSPANPKRDVCLLGTRISVKSLTSGAEAMRRAGPVRRRDDTDRVNASTPVAEDGRMHAVLAGNRLVRVVLRMAARASAVERLARTASARNHRSRWLAVRAPAGPALSDLLGRHRRPHRTLGQSQQPPLDLPTCSSLPLPPERVRGLGHSFQGRRPPLRRAKIQSMRAVASPHDLAPYAAGWRERAEARGRREAELRADRWRRLPALVR
jgi:hypothetical protein